MTNTIPSVPRNWFDRVHALLYKIANESTLEGLEAECLGSFIPDILSATSPAGVDGLEVVATLLIDDPTDQECGDWDIEVESKVAERMSEHGGGQHELCRLSDSQAIIDGLRGENERIRLNIAEYNEAIACYHAECDQQAQRIGELEGLLRDSAELIKHGVFEDGYCCCGSSVDSHGLGDGHSPVDALAYHAGQVLVRIDAAMSAGKEGE